MTKIYVFVDSGGSVLGTVPVLGVESDRATIFAGAAPQSERAFRVLELELESELSSAAWRTSGDKPQQEQSVDSFHQHLSEVVRSTTLPEVDDYLDRLKQGLQ